MKIKVDEMTRDELIKLVKKLLKDKEKSVKKMQDLEKEIKKQLSGLKYE